MEKRIWEIKVSLTNDYHDNFSIVMEMPDNAMIGVQKIRDLLEGMFGTLLMSMSDSKLTMLVNSTKVKDE